MFLNKKYKPWLLAATDDTRPILTMVNIERNPKDRNQGIMAATDGFALVSVPVYLQSDDLTGMVHANLLKEIQTRLRSDRMDKSAKAPAEVANQIHTFQLDEGRIMRFFSKWGAAMDIGWEEIEGNYPDYRPVVPTIRPQKKSTAKARWDNTSPMVQMGPQEYHFDARYFNRLCRASGS